MEVQLSKKLTCWQTTSTAMPKFPPQVILFKKQHKISNCCMVFPLFPGACIVFYSGAFKMESISQNSHITSPIRGIKSPNTEPPYFNIFFVVQISLKTSLLHVETTVFGIKNSCINQKKKKKIVIQQQNYTMSILACIHYKITPHQIILDNLFQVSNQ